MDLQDRLEAYAASDIYPMHMPGHKRNTTLCSMPNPYALDVTEVEGTDNLYEPEEILRSMQQRAAALWGALDSFVLINGSSGGLLAAIRAVAAPGETVLIARNCHQSVYHGVMVGGLCPVYLQPEVLPSFQICGAVTKEQVKAAFLAHPGIRAVVITSPTYEGICSDIGAIADVVHHYGAVLIVDEAHGAHLGFSDAFPPSAVRLGADIVVQSLHKNLPVFTQCAILHRTSDRVSSAAIRRNLRIFGSSSPSYLLMASADRCFTLLSKQKDALFSAYSAWLDRFYAGAVSLRHLRLLTPADCASPFDRGKLYISCRGTSIDGAALAKRLREDYRIEMEMATVDAVLAMTSIADTDEGFDRLLSALLEIDRTLHTEPVQNTISFTLPEMAVAPSVAERMPHEPVSAEEAAGMVCGELIRMYPPGIPVFVPGEVLEREKLCYLQDAAKRGLTVIGSEGNFPQTVLICKND